ncbi:MAG: CHAD domain-containing protein [Ktedonobacterales bacterium]
MEIETKYTVVGFLAPSAITSLELRHYVLEPQGDERHHDLLLDTADRAITSTRHALRLRRFDDGRPTVITFKGPNTAAEGLHSREEIEAPLPDDISNPLDYARWPDEIAQRVAALIDGEKYANTDDSSTGKGGRDGKGRRVAAQSTPTAHLMPLVEMDIHRRTWTVTHSGQTIAELALDVGEIRAAEAQSRGTWDGDATTDTEDAQQQSVKRKKTRKMWIHELEVELKDVGQQSDLDALAKRLMAQLPLRPEAQSKLARGLALLEPREAAGASGGETPFALAARTMIRQQLRRACKHAADVRDEKDPELVHKMRVAIRRLRTALQLLEEAPEAAFADFPGTDARRLRRLRRRLGGLTHALGAVRDTDLFIERVRTYSEAYPELHDDLEPLRHELQAQRQSARATLIAQLDTRKLAKTLARLYDLSADDDGQQDENPHADSEQSDTQDGRRLQVRHVAGSAIWRRYEAVLSYKTVISDSSLIPLTPPPTLHHLRIALKRLRYVIELFEDELGKGKKGTLRTLMQAQDHLGALQDAVVALALVTRLRDAHPDNRGLTIYAAALTTQRDTLRRDFIPLWQQLADQPLRDRLAGLLVGL